MLRALTVDQVVEMTGLKKNYIYKLIHEKKIPYYKPLGGRVYFKESEVEAFIFRNYQNEDYENASNA